MAASAQAESSQADAAQLHADHAKRVNHGSSDADACPWRVILQETS